MRTINKQYPDTVDELLTECRALIDRYDLYSLGKPKTPDDWPNWPDGTEVDAGEYAYGVAMVPAQWVTHVLGAKGANNAD